MNGRIKLKELATLIRPIIIASMPNVHVGTGYDPDYMNQYTSLLPAVWIIGQTGLPLDDGRGYSGHFAQMIGVDIFVRIATSRYIEGEIDPEERLNLLFNVVSDVLKDTTPNGGADPFVWTGYRDGPTSDSLLAADLTFRTKVRYQRNIP